MMTSAVDVVAWAWGHPTATAKEKMILVFLAYSYDEGVGVSWASYTEMGEATGLSQSSCMRAVRQLVDCGSLHVEKWIAGAGRNLINRYSFPLLDGSVAGVTLRGVQALPTERRRSGDRTKVATSM